MSEGEPLRLDRDGGVVTVQLDRPAARNAINRAMRRALRDALQEAAVDPGVRVVVIRGDERAFCAGGDIKEMGGGRADAVVKLGLAKQIVTAIADMPKPVVAVVRGHAAGAGFSLALACDLVLADETAVFTAPFAGRGLVPDMGGTYWLARQLGLHRAKDVFLTGRPVGATEAAEVGLVARLWPAAELDARAAGLVGELASASPTALGLTKKLLNRAGDNDLGASLDAEQLAQALAADTDEARARLPRARTTGGVTTTDQEEGP